MNALRYWLNVTFLIATLNATLTIAYVGWFGAR